MSAASCTAVLTLVPDASSNPLGIQFNTPIRAQVVVTNGGTDPDYVTSGNLVITNSGGTPISGAPCALGIIDFSQGPILVPGSSSVTLLATVTFFAPPAGPPNASATNTYYVGANMTAQVTGAFSATVDSVIIAGIAYP